MVNKTKRELYEENRKLKRKFKTYNEFWETDAIEECTKQLRFTKHSIIGISVVLLIISAFLLGLAN